MFKPTAMEQYISTLLEALQILALKVVKEEHDRWERGDFTPEEWVELAKSRKLFRELGENVACAMEKIAARVFNG